MSIDALSAEATPNGGQSTDEWVLAWIAAGVLAIPRSHIRTVEQTEVLSPAEEGEPESGWYTKPHKPWGAYSLDDELELQVQRDCERYTVFLAANEYPVGLCCERLKLLSRDTDLKAFPRAACMRNDGPVQALGLLDGEEVILISSGPALVRHLERVRG